MIWRVAWQMVRANTLQLLRDRRAFILMLLMPIVFTSILSFALSDLFGGSGIPKFTVGVYNADHGTISQALMQTLKAETSQFTVTDVQTTEDGRKQLDNEAIDVFVRIPADLTVRVNKGEPTNVQIEALLNNGTKQQVVQSIVDTFGRQQSIHTHLSAVLQSRAKEAAPVRFQEAASGLRPVTAGSYYAVGMMVMFLLMQGFNQALKMVEERNTDRYTRLIAAPASRQALCLGQWLTTFINVFAQGLILLVSEHFLLHISVGPWGQILGLTACYAAALAGLANVFGTFVRNRQLMDSVGTVGVPVLAAFGGSIFPVYAFPHALQVAGNMLPNGLALNSLLDSVSGIATADLVTPMVVLLAIGVVLGLVSAIRYGRAEVWR